MRAPVLQAKHGPAVSARGSGRGSSSAHFQPSAAQAKQGSFPFGTNAPCPILFRAPCGKGWERTIARRLSRRRMRRIAGCVVSAPMHRRPRQLFSLDHPICRPTPHAGTQPHARRLQRSHARVDAALCRRRAGAFVVGIETTLGAHRRLRLARRPVSLHARFASYLRRRGRTRRQPAGALAAAALAGCRFGPRESHRAETSGSPRTRLRPRGGASALPAFVPAPHSARRHPRHISVAAALGLDLRHLAAAHTLDCGASSPFSRDFSRAPPVRDGLSPHWPRSFPSRF